MNAIWITVLFTICGYLLGSILFAETFTRIMADVSLIETSDDGNPGTANAFKKGGFCCGIMSLIGDMAKGTIPVYMYLSIVKNPGMYLVPVMLAPVIGHAYSVFNRFCGGKCIAVSFGTLIGLFPDLRMGLILAFFYILFSIVKIKPHSIRTLVSFVAAGIVSVLVIKSPNIIISMWLMTLVVIHKHFYAR